MKRMIGALVAAWLLTGCAQILSSQVDQSQIYTAYSAAYNETGAQLTLSATFTVGGTTGTYVDLQSPSAIDVNGQPLAKTTDIINQIIYQANSGEVSATAWQTQQAFVYTDGNGKSYTNTLQIPPAVEVSTASGASISKTAPLSVGWTTANGILPTETLHAYVDTQVTVTGPTQNGTTVQATGSADGATGTSGAIAIDPTGLAQLPSGAAKIYLCRSTEGPATAAPSVGGNLRASYCSLAVVVTLTP